MPYAYLAARDDDALTIIDVANPAAPTFVGSVQNAAAPDSLDSPFNVFVLGDYAYLNSYNDNSITIVDISDPTNPILVGSLAGGGAPNFLLRASAVFVIGNIAYAIGENDNSLTIIDVTNPAAPAFLGNIAGAGPGVPWLGRPRQLYVVGNYAYLAAAVDDSLTIIDITNPAIPVYSGSIQGAGAPNFLNLVQGIFVVGDLAYTVAGLDDSFSIFNVANPAAPFLVGSIQGAGAPPGGNWLNQAMNVFVLGNYAYVAAPGDNALTIIDVSTPAAPVLAGGIQGAGAPNWLSFASDVVVLGDYAYVAARGDAALTIIDITNPAAPTVVGSIQGAGAPNFLNAARGVKVPLSAPRVQTDAATGVVNNSALLNATLDTGGLICQCYFDWGETVAYGNRTPVQNIAAGLLEFNYTAYPLKSNTTYHFRAIATNALGTSTGADRSFTTSQVPHYPSTILPEVDTRPATLITQHTARLNGVVIEDNGVIGDTRFQWGLSTNYGNNTSWEQGYNKGDEFFVDLNKLAEGQAFHFRAQYRNQGTIYNGRDMVFNTLSPLGPVTLVTDEIMQLLEAV